MESLPCLTIFNTSSTVLNVSTKMVISLLGWKEFGKLWEIWIADSGSSQVHEMSSTYLAQNQMYSWPGALEMFSTFQVTNGHIPYYGRERTSLGRPSGNLLVLFWKRQKCSKLISISEWNFFIVFGRAPSGSYLRRIAKP